MTPENWKKSYEQEKPPHWAEDSEPSPLAKQLLVDLPEETKNQILEIGVGNGRDSIYFAEHNNEVTGIDIAEGAIKLAEENATKKGLQDKINFRIGNAEKLDFKNESFDAVYSISVLHATMLPDSLGEISRVLKLDGKVIIYLYEMTETGGKKYWFWKKEKIEKLLSDSNLAVEDQWDFFDDRHEGEKTKVLVFKLRKKNKK